MKDDIIYAVYVDDTIFWSPDDSKIESTISELKDLNFDIALLGCGGYGLPLCDFIKTKLINLYFIFAESWTCHGYTDTRVGDLIA